MSTRRRKKAIQKVVKLLNLATSSNLSESNLALRHAESLIRQYAIAQRELPILQLCDRSMLYKVSWGNSAPRFVKETSQRGTPTDSVYQRRFSEKTSSDPSRAYESVRTILDDMEEMDVGSHEDHQPSAKEGDRREFESDHQSMVVDPASSADAHILDDQDMDDMAAENIVDDVESSSDRVDAESASSMNGFTDNVIDAAQAFRPAHADFGEALKTQYSTSDPSVPFSEDDYWSSVYEKLADFDEAKVQSEIEDLDTQLSLAQENLQLKKQKRHEHEQEEVLERAERARIERSFEEAIERAFQARAKSYEAWEASCNNIRMDRLRDEQEAIQGYESVSQALEKNKDAFQQHLQRKEDYRAAKIMHELRRQLMLSVSTGDDASASYDRVIEIMEENSLSLKDLEFSDIKNKSLFIRLLERESALISDVQEREGYTEEMLDKFLTSNYSKKESKVSENPVQQIQRLLVVASEGGQFETQKSLEQVLYLMESNDIGVRDIGYQFIKKYSVFIRLINWEAEQIVSLPEREKFTAKILEEYIQHSVQKPSSAKEHKINQ
ncbi:DUF2786 domain-containing protein [Marinomonas posidonica]|uniref:Uncharacterized protein n=1 Tax=Marinomonas posidonica (strain CECT 7376 / NCIMB 14433 / IVIA-Po-181) TaxID=491952 RepID=F6CZF0_MARPP|nr:DUF2786 domain-containing protein [Marinomonas posidonica]AEF54687.1 hypothetical protein Mar181_1648 [Marinomonas posidonica IVIA-Po-181]